MKLNNQIICLAVISRHLIQKAISKQTSTTDVAVANPLPKKSGENPEDCSLRSSHPSAPADTAKNLVTRSVLGPTTMLQRVGSAARAEKARCISSIRANSLAEINGVS